MRFSNIFSSFSHKNFRYYFAGQGLSLIGTWMQSTAMGWLIYRMTGSSAKLGAVGFVTMLPAILFGYIAGVFSDRMDRKKSLYITQGTAMLCAFLISWLSSSGHIKVFHIMFIGFISGVAGAFDMPLRHSFVVEMVGKEQLPNALALNSIMFNVSRMIGPAIAGFIIKYSDESSCFWLNFFSYFFIMYAIFKIRPYSIKKKKEEESSIMSDLKSGLYYAYVTPYIKYPLYFLMMISFIIMPMITLLPVYVKHLNADARTMGLFMSMIGMGAIISGLQMASKRQNHSLAIEVSRYSLLYGCALLLLSFSRSVIFSCLFFFLAGLGTSRQAVGINTLIQTLVKEEMRGRIVSIYTLSFMGLAPFGNIFWGWFAEKYGISSTILLGGIWVIGANLWFLNEMSNFKKILLAEKEKYDFSEYQNIKEII